MRSWPTSTKRFDCSSNACSRRRLKRLLRRSWTANASGGRRTGRTGARTSEQGMAKFVQSATTLEVKDVRASEAFYREKLGFRAGLFFGEPPTFCIISRDDV